MSASDSEPTAATSASTPLHVLREEERGGIEGGERADDGGWHVVRRPVGSSRRPTGRERHDEKITIYVSSGELFDLEQARLVLRGEHGLAVDRGRIVREAVAVLLADLEDRGESSTLVRRLRKH